MLVHSLGDAVDISLYQTNQPNQAHLLVILIAVVIPLVILVAEVILEFTVILVVVAIPLVILVVVAIPLVILVVAAILFVGSDAAVARECLNLTSR